MITTATKDETGPSLKGSVQNMRESVRDMATQADHDLRDTAAKMGQKTRTFVENAKEEAFEASDKVTKHIHEKPLQSSVIALGIGFVLGALFRR